MRYKIRSQFYSEAKNKDALATKTLYKILIEVLNESIKVNNGRLKGC